MNVEEITDDQRKLVQVSNDLRALRETPGYQAFRDLMLEKIADLYSRWMEAQSDKEQWRLQAASALAWEVTHLVDEKISLGDSVLQMVQARHSEQNAELWRALESSDATRAEVRQQHNIVR